MSLARWDPFLQLTDLQNEMNRLFRREFPSIPRTEQAMTSEFMPAADIYEDEKMIKVKLDVPGINAKDLDIRVEGNILTVSGERKFEKEEKKENFRRVERAYGSFTRSFTLPGSVDTDSIRANFENGILEIDAAKRAEARGKQIKVSEHPSTEQKKVAA